MPTVLRVGYRSIWVDAAAWTQMVVGLLSLLLAAGCLAPQSGFSLYWGGQLSLLVLGLLLLVSGQALLRRLEWGRRLSWALIAVLSPLLLVSPWVAMQSVWLALSLSVMVCLAVLWTLSELNSGCVRQEFA